MIPVGMGPGGGMGPGPRNINLDPILPVVGRMLGAMDLKGPLKTAVDCVDSGPLANVCLVSLKSAPYVLDPSNPVVSHFDNALSCRMRYLEAAVISMASAVHNVVFGLVFTALSVLTLGQVKPIVDQMRKHWIHTALATAASAIAFVGTVSPTLGVKANAAALFGIGVVAVQWVEGGVIGKIGTVYQAHSRDLRNAFLRGLEGDRMFFEQHFAPLFNHLDNNLNDRVQTFSDLMGIFQGVRMQVPPVVPIVTVDAILDSLEGALPGITSGAAGRGWVPVGA